ncbi:hypothetical protein [Paenibacillus elgii]
MTDGEQEKGRVRLERMSRRRARLNSLVSYEPSSAASGSRVPPELIDA